MSKQPLASKKLYMFLCVLLYTFYYNDILYTEAICINDNHMIDTLIRFIDELQRLLQHEIDIRKQVERDIGKIKDDLHDQVNKEKSQRDEIAKQLQAMKGRHLKSDNCSVEHASSYHTKKQVFQRLYLKKGQK